MNCEWYKEKMNILRLVLQRGCWALALLGLAACVGINPATNLMPRKGTGLMVEESVYNFGYAGLGQNVRHTFNIKNSGSETVVISEVITDCGCTVALLSGKEIKPGGTGTVQATFQTKGYEGTQEKNIFIRSNDSVQPEVILTLKGVVKKGAVLDPQGVNLGDVVRGEAATGKVKLLQLSDDRLAILKIESSQYLRTEAVHFRDDNSRGYEIEIILSGEVPAGSFIDLITLHTNLPKQPRLDVPVWANVIER